MGGKATFTPVFDAWRFYEDGTESGSSPIANQDTNINRDVTSGNATCHLRVRVQETGGAGGAATDDWGLQYQVGGAGGWTTVTDASARVRAFTTSGLSDGSATTNRGTNGITDGSGSFVAGEQEEANGVIEDSQLTTSNFTEHVWALEIVSADNTGGDTLGFRLTLNGGNPGMTNSVTPVITIVKVNVYNDSVSESMGAAEAVTSQAEFDRAVAESVGVAETVTGFTSYEDAVDETVGVADAVSATRISSGVIAESVGVAEQIDSQAEVTRSVAESIGTEEQITNQAEFVRSVGESMGVADAVAAAGSVYSESVDESMGIADAPSSQMIAGVSVAEMASIVDQVSGTLQGASSTIHKMKIGNWYRSWAA